MITTIALIASISGIYNVASCDNFEITGGSAFKIKEHRDSFKMKVYFINSSKRTLKSNKEISDSNELIFKNSNLSISARFESDGKVVFQYIKDGKEEVTFNNACYVRKT